MTGVSRRATPVALATVLGAAVAVPLVIALGVLTTRRWHPVLDLAMIEFRVRDVGGRWTPLIGLPGRIGDFPDQGSHPGPLGFWLLAPVYRLAGASAWGLLAGAVVLVLGATALAWWAVWRRIAPAAGRALPLVLVAVTVVVLRGYGTEVLTQPWNPYLPVIWWAVVLMAVWGVLDGDHAMAVVVVAAGSIAAQTHIPYLGLWLGMLALVAAVLVVRAWREPAARRGIARRSAVSAGVAAVLWSPVVIEQWRRSPGNLTRIVDHFLSPPADEVTVGWGRGVALVLRHLDIVQVARQSVDGWAPSGAGAFVRAGYGMDTATAAGGVVVGGAVLVCWGASAWVAWRRRLRTQVALHAVVGWSAVLAVVSLSRVFGKVWYYLSLWLWLTSVLMVVAAVWTAWTVWTARSVGTADTAAAAGTADTAATGATASQARGTRDTVRRFAGAAVVAVAVLSWGAFAVEAGRATAPEQHLSDTLAAVIGPTAQALADGVGEATGRDGRYTVTYADAANFGSLAYGLVNELERRGFSAGMPPTWRVPVTAHRVIPEADATAQVRLATGAYIATVAALPGAVLVAEHEPRDADGLARSAAVRAEVVAALRAAGLDDLVVLLDENLFGLQLDPRVDGGVQRRVDELIRLGVRTAVFVLPPETGA